MTEFTGFPAETFAFLAGIAANNDKDWFEANRSLYDVGYVEAGRAFVSAMGPRLATLSPTVRFEPKVNGSLSRVNRDIRFSRDKRPYKDHLDLWFWHGDRRGWDCPGFWFRLTAEKVHLGTGMHGFEKDRLESFRHAVVLPRSGKALVSAVAAVKAAGPYEIGEKTRKVPPRGFEADPDRAEFLLYEGLTAGTQMPASAAREANFLDVCFKHFAATWPVGKWLLEEIA
jgi:TIGR02453 family protein